eukprot:TRINITY_DN4759_c0_g2_i1.p1 TRINITY_DN4759_c0_g2~~TRINITY_DN4759_c0_g2_i1.p1  ORF type:complete len:144 (+),score=6.33 TRINITY_DN4759_c0_g2_i1:28-459(+)
MNSKYNNNHNNNKIIINDSIQIILSFYRKLEIRFLKKKSTASFDAKCLSIWEFLDPIPKAFKPSVAAVKGLKTRTPSLSPSYMRPTKAAILGHTPTSPVPNQDLRFDSHPPSNLYYLFLMIYHVCHFLSRQCILFFLAFLEVP